MGVMTTRHPWLAPRRTSCVMSSRTDVLLASAYAALPGSGWRAGHDHRRALELGPCCGGATDEAEAPLSRASRPLPC